MRVAVVDFDQAQPQLTGSGALCRSFFGRRNAVDAFLWPFGEPQHDALRAAVAYVFEARGAAGLPLSNVAAEPILRAHGLAVERHDDVVGPKSNARSRRSRLHVLH